MCVNQTPFVFHNNAHKKKVGSKAKMKVDFLWIFDNPILNYLIYEKSYLNTVAIFWPIYQKQLEA